MNFSLYTGSFPTKLAQTGQHFTSCNAQHGAILKQIILVNPTSLFVALIFANLARVVDAGDGYRVTLP